MKTLNLLILIALCFNGFAQNSEPKNELGLSVYGLEINVKHWGDGLSQPYYANGLQYKRQLCADYKFRLSASYFEHSETAVVPYSDSIGGGGQLWSYTTHVFELRSGVERTFFSTKKIVPFVFAEIAYRQENERGVVLGYSNSGNFKGENSKNTPFIGGIVGMGVKYKPVNNVYIGLETSIGSYLPIKGVESGFTTIFSPIKTIVVGVQF